MWVIPLISSIIGAAFARTLWLQYRERRRTYQLFWLTGMIMFVLATFGEFIGGAFGWSTFIYKLYYFSGVALPGFLGTGTVYLMARSARRRLPAHIYAGGTVLAALLFLGAVASADLNLSVLAQSSVAPEHAAILPIEARRPYSLLLSAIGGSVLLLGALYSWIRHGLSYNRWIFLGGLVFVTGGTFASRLGILALIPFSNLVGVALIFLGVMQAEQMRQHRPVASA